MGKNGKLTFDDFLNESKYESVACEFTLDELLKDCEGENPNEDLFDPYPLRVGFKRLSPSAIIPTKAHPSDSGFDLYASEDVVIQPGETKVVPTGIAVGLPQGTEAQVRPRSGITSKTKLRVQLGTIDQGYTGEIGVIVDNIYCDPLEDGDFLYRAAGVDEEPIGERFYEYGTYHIRKGDKIAQLVVQYLPPIEAVEVDELTGGDRGGNGFGSSGTRGAEK